MWNARWPPSQRSNQRPMITRMSGAAGDPAMQLLTEVGYSALARPTGHATPVPPKPQYPSGFFVLERYCWW